MIRTEQRSHKNGHGSLGHQVVFEYLLSGLRRINFVGTEVNASRGTLRRMPTWQASSGRPFLNRNVCEF